MATPTRISVVCDNPTDAAAFEAEYPPQLKPVKKLPGLGAQHVVAGHSCLGVHITETETRGFREAIRNPWPGWELAEEPRLVVHHEGAEEGKRDRAFWILDAFESVQIRVAR